MIALDFNPNSIAQSALFFLSAPSGGRPALGGGSRFDGLELVGSNNPLCVSGQPTGSNCQELAIIEPDQPQTGQSPAAGYVLRNSIVHDFTGGIWVGGNGSLIARNLFRDNDRLINVAGVRATGTDLYADSTYSSANTRVVGNVFAGPPRYALNINGNTDRSTFAGATVAGNLFRKASNRDQMILMNDVRDVRIRDNVLTSLHPEGAAPANDGMLFDRVDEITVNGNTLTDFRAAITFSDIGAPGPPSLTNVRIANNRIYRNQFGLRIRAPYPSATAPVGIDATDNWWGANGGAGTAGNREGFVTPVNGVQFRNSSGAEIPPPPASGVDYSDALQLTCSTPATVTADTPSPLTGAVAGMPAVNHGDDERPWFERVRQPLMAADAEPASSRVSGFDRPPSTGALGGRVVPSGGSLTGWFIPAAPGPGAALVALDSQQVRCPFDAVPADIDVDKTASAQVAYAGQRVTFRIRVRNRGRAPVYRLRTCDRPPRALRLLRASRRLRAAAGRRHCLAIRRLRPGQQRTFRLTFRISPAATGTTIDNTAHADTPIAPGRARTSHNRHARGRASVIVPSRLPDACAAGSGPTAHASC